MPENSETVRMEQEVSIWNYAMVDEIVQKNIEEIRVVESEINGDPDSATHRLVLEADIHETE